MNQEFAERLEILRRIGERGLKLANKDFAPARGWLSRRPRFEYELGQERAHSEHIDLWQHLLDELALVSSPNTKE